MKKSCWIFGGLIFGQIFPAFAAGSSTVQCPSSATIYQKSGQHSVDISGISILQAPVRSAIDFAAPPSLVPDQSATIANNLIASWNLDTNTPGWRYYLECVYGENEDFLIFDVTGLRRCTQKLASKVPSQMSALCR